jgi:hypothetical protein
VLPANDRLCGKWLPGTNTLAYLASSAAMKEKSFITLAPVVIKLGTTSVGPVSHMDFIKLSEASAYFFSN